MLNMYNRSVHAHPCYVTSTQYPIPGRQGLMIRMHMLLVGGLRTVTQVLLTASARQNYLSSKEPYSALLALAEQQELPIS